MLTSCGSWRLESVSKKIHWGAVYTKNTLTLDDLTMFAEGNDPNHPSWYGIRGHLITSKGDLQKGERNTHS